MPYKNSKNYFLDQIFAKTDAVITHNVAKIADGIAVWFEKCLRDNTAASPAFCIPTSIDIVCLCGPSSL